MPSPEYTPLGSLAQSAVSGLRQVGEVRSGREQDSDLELGSKEGDREQIHIVGAGAGGKIRKGGRLVCRGGQAKRGGRGGGSGQSTRGGGSELSTRGGGSTQSTRGGSSGLLLRGGGSGQSTRGGWSTKKTRGGRSWHVPRVGRGGQDTRGDAKRKNRGPLNSVDEVIDEPVENSGENDSLDQADHAVDFSTESSSGLPVQDSAEAATGGEYR